jgi:hypothetical protein
MAQGGPRRVTIERVGAIAARRGTGALLAKLSARVYAAARPPCPWRVHRGVPRRVRDRARRSDRPRDEAWSASRHTRRAGPRPPRAHVGMASPATSPRSSASERSGQETMHGALLATLATLAALATPDARAHLFMANPSRAATSHDRARRSDRRETRHGTLLATPRCAGRAARPRGHGGAATSRGQRVGAIGRETGHGALLAKPAARAHPRPRTWLFVASPWRAATSHDRARRGAIGCDTRHCFSSIKDDFD